MSKGDSHKAQNRTKKHFRKKKPKNPFDLLPEDQRIMIIRRIRYMNMIRRSIKEDKRQESSE
jgi:hypothetical protein